MRADTQEKIGAAEQGSIPFGEPPVLLNEHVEQLVGANGEPMLFHRHHGRYIRLSPMGAELVRRLDGHLTPGLIRKYLAERFPERPDLPDFVDKFFHDLRQADFLTVSPQPEGMIKGVTRFLFRNPVLRFPIFKSSLDRVAAAIADWLRAITLPGSSYAVIILLASALTVSLWKLVTTGLGVQHGLVQWPYFIAFYIQHVLTHELSHSVACRWYGVRVREAGIGLMLYLIPIAYVDRTDAYRLGNRWSRAMIAAVGPMHDLVMSSIWATVSLMATSATVQATTHAMFVFAFLMMLGNLNLLFPTDGYHAMEAAVGEINFRRRAGAYLWAIVRGKPAPFGLGNLPLRTRLLYPLYGLLALAGLSAFAIALARSISLAVLQAKGGG